MPRWPRHPRRYDEARAELEATYRSALSDLDAAENRTSTTTLAHYNELVDRAHTKRTASIVLTGAGVR